MMRCRRTHVLLLSIASRQAHQSVDSSHYTNGRPAGEVSESHETLFENRPGEATAGELATSLTHQWIPPVLVNAWSSLKR